MSVTVTLSLYAAPILIGLGSCFGVHELHHRFGYLSVSPSGALGVRVEVIYSRQMHIEQTAVIVDDYDDAIDFYVQALGFELLEDSPSLTNDGRAKRWVVVRPPGAITGLLLAQADGEGQRTAVGNQFAGRVGLFLRVDDFDASYRRMLDHGVEFLTEPCDEPYGRFAVFVDVAGNKWDLLGPR